MHALLLATANTQLLDKHSHTALQWAEIKGQPSTDELVRRPQPAAAPPAASPDAGEAAVNSPAPLPLEIFQSAQQGELQKVVKWLGKGGSVDAVCSAPTDDGQTGAVALLHATATIGQLEITKELLKQGASVDLQTSHGLTALTAATQNGHLSIVLVLLQHSANPDLQNIHGGTALMSAAYQGHEACAQALLRAKVDTELVDSQGWTALQWAEHQGHTAITKLLRQHVPCLSLGLNVHLCAVLPLAWQWVMLWDMYIAMLWVVLSVVLGAMASIAFSRTVTAGPGQHRVAQQRQPHRSARHAKAQGRTSTAKSTRHAEPLQPAAAVTPQALQAEQAARADAAMEGSMSEEAAEQAKGQTRSKKSKKQKKAGRAATAGDESSEAPPAAAPTPPPTAAPKPAAVSAAERVAIAGGGRAALATAPREVRQGSLGAEAHARCDKLLKAQQRAEREAKQAVAVQAARLAAVERVREVAAEKALRVEARAAAAFKARDEAVTAAEAAAAAAAKADTLERAMTDGGEGGGRWAARPSEASEAAEVPNDYMCPITAEIMTDPVSTVDGFTYEREAITEWLRTKDTSPFTGATLESKALIPNLSLRSMIRSFIEACSRRGLQLVD